MCLGFPGLIETLDEFSAVVDIAGTKREISIMLLAEEVAVGDYVMVHAGFAVSKMDPEEAKETLRVILEVANELPEVQDER